jgi:hypothetical protein
MTEQAHFKYEANPSRIVFTSPPPETTDIEIEAVSFLMPVRIACKINGVSRNVFGGVDYAKKEFALSDTDVVDEAAMRDAVFKFLKIVTTLPEESYRASDDVYENASSAKQEYETMRRENVGDI